MLLQALVFALVGLGMEVVFTGALSRNRFLMGYSSLWYLPLYALLPSALALTQPVMGGWAWPLRGLAYACVFHVGEFLGMGALRLLLGKSPSEESYFRSAWNVRGLTRLDFAPAFFLAGLLFEAVYRAFPAP